MRVLLLCALVVISSCSTQRAIRRDAQGMRPLSKAKKVFSGIRKKVALLPFFNEAPYGGTDLAVTATQELMRELSRTGEFVIDPLAAKSFGSSKEIYSGGGANLVQVSRKAKILGVNFIVFGRIMDARIREKSDEIGFIRKTKAYAESKVEVRIFDVNSNKEIYTATLKGYADDSSFRFFKSEAESRLEYRRNLLRYVVKIAVRKSIPQVVTISSKLDWVGRVAKIIGNKIYINAGRKSGVHISDILKVVTEGVEIYDPATGALLGVSKGEIKGTIEVIDYFGDDGTIAILHSGGSVIEGDFVQLY